MHKKHVLESKRVDYMITDFPPFDGSCAYVSYLHCVTYFSTSRGLGQTVCILWEIIFLQPIADILLSLLFDEV